MLAALDILMYRACQELMKEFKFKIHMYLFSYNLKMILDIQNIL